MKILILCTGNTCRSQMAEAYLQSLDTTITVVSAGTKPGAEVHPKAIQVMAEKGINLVQSVPKSVNSFLNAGFDYVITVCDGAKESCPAFTGSVKHQLHIGFEDPAEATGSEDKILDVFRKVRDEIFDQFYTFYVQEITG
ncbi:MAG: arsenate reductase ArsC [Bacteroidales bacterium]|nr:arsenate reductase ArsC [Bacteroidales bacterium]